MSIALKMDVQGAKEIEAMLDKLGIKAARSMKTALRKAARPIIKEARANAPKRSGELRRSLMSEVKSYRGAGGSYAKVGPRSSSPAAHYAHLVEMGTAPHSLAPEKRAASDVKSRNENVIHPGSTAKPFLRPAFDTNIDQAQLIIRDTLSDMVRKESGK